MEKLRNRIDLRLECNEKDYVRWISKPGFMTQQLFNNSLIAIPKVTERLDKPAYVEMFVLNLSKVLMYEFNYNCIKNKYGNKARLLFTNTDRLVSEIKTLDIYQDFNKNKKCLSLVTILINQNIMIIPKH